MKLTNLRPRIAALGAIVAVAAIALFAFPEPAAADDCVNNDDFECASVVGALPFSETINNAGFTIESGEPNPTCIDGQTDGLTAWWTWTAPSTDSFVFTTDGLDYYTNLSIYTGSAVDDLDKVACGSFLHTDFDAATVAATLAATAGTVYHIQIDYFGGFVDGGPVTLNANVNLPPTTVLVSPDASTVFTDTPTGIDAVYSDPNTFNNLRYLDLKITAGSGAPVCHVRFNKDRNQFQIKDGGWVDVGWLTGPAAYSTEFCTLDAGESRFEYVRPDTVPDLDSILVHFGLSFSSDFVGRHGLRLKARDDAGSWSSRDWRGYVIVATPAAPPTTDAVTPDDGTALAGTPITLSASYSDPNGWQNLRYGDLRVTDPAMPACKFRYHQNLNRLFLHNGSGWVSAGSPGSGDLIATPKCSLDAAASSVTGSGNTMVVNFSVAFSSDFLGDHGLRLRAKDDSRLVAPLATHGEVSVVDTIEGELIRHTTYEAGEDRVESAHDAGPGTLGETDETSRWGDYSGYAIRRPGETGSHGRRAEWHGVDLFAAGVERWQGISYFVPLDWYQGADSGWDGRKIWQFHAAGSNPPSPIFALEIRDSAGENPTLHLSRKRIVVRADGSIYQYSETLWSEPLVIGEWIDFVFNVVVSTGSDGRIVLYRNQEIVHEVYGPTVPANGSAYSKWGVYGQPGRILFDEIRIAERNGANAGASDAQMLALVSPPGPPPGGP